MHMPAPLMRREPGTPGCVGMPDPPFHAILCAKLAYTLNDPGQRARNCHVASCMHHAVPIAKGGKSASSGRSTLADEPHYRQRAWVHANMHTVTASSSLVDMSRAYGR
jgi:hypothetical protein